MSETLEKLMDAAEADIRLRGYHAVSFRDLADALGIKSASVHYYFRQKEDLGIALVERYATRFFDQLRASTSDGEDKVSALCALYRKALLESDRICLCGMLGAESCGLPDGLSKAVTTFFEANVTWVIAALPDSLGKSARKSKAEHIIATLQGSMMLANSLQNPKIFDRAVKDLMG